MSQKYDETMTEIERRLAERAEKEFEAAGEAPTPAEDRKPDEFADPTKYSMFDDRWEPPQRPLYDYEVIALINRDSGRYIATGLMLDSPEDIDAFVSKQLETYSQSMEPYQIDHYRMTLTGGLFRLVLGQLLQQQAAAIQRDNGAYNQIVREVTKKNKRRKNN